MFSHNKRLQYTVRVSQTNPGLANLMLEQFGGPQGELAAACRYFTQALGEDAADLQRLAKRKQQSLGGEFTPMGLGDFFHSPDDPLHPDNEDDDEEDK